MNGPIAFSRTLRALDADRFRLSNLILLVVAALSGCWLWWFLAGSIPQYEISEDVRIEPNRFIANFPARVLDHVRPGQTATLQLDGLSVPGKVIAVGVDAATGRARTILLPATENPPPAAAHARAAIEVERVSPATLLLRATGRDKQ